MDRTTTLFVINQDTPDNVISEVADAAAEKQARLSCLLLGPAPPLPTYAYGVPPYGAMNIPPNWVKIVEKEQQALNHRVNEVEALLARSGPAGDVIGHLCATTDIKHLVGTRARVCDIAHIAPHLHDAPDIMREAAHGVLFRSPIGLMLNAAPYRPVSRVFVAWNSSDAAAKAVHAALPYLLAAQEVVIGCFDPVITADKEGADPGTDVAAWLSHRGCTVTVTQYPSGGREIAQCLQDRAKEGGADLLVMGAYGHTRMVQAVFGGTTRTLMEQTDLPVLLAH
ncbi:universal stress protein [Roseobacter sp. YSTF-M11]|uniref:Universal stress protein n=1 Tax=Roseobacter insulae TaxID=2859783 RepID=A0A9X1FRF6_9RHOB|nr:universal stress protein [Roseobacter insulae]MBW4706211.1 universal stress protein [Roseobacter insulae]